MRAFVVGAAGAVGKPLVRRLWPGATRSSRVPGMPIARANCIRLAQLRFNSTGSTAPPSDKQWPE